MSICTFLESPHSIRSFLSPNQSIGSKTRDLGFKQRMIDTGKGDGTVTSFEKSVVEKKGTPESILASSRYQRLVGSRRWFSPLEGPRTRSLVDLSMFNI